MIASVIALFDGDPTVSVVPRSNRSVLGFKTAIQPNGAETYRTQAEMNCNSPKTIHTIGHSTRTIEVFVPMLQAHAVELLIDVRRWPGSRRHPQFNREALANSLQEHGIAYLWRGDLGGFRKPAADSVNTAWQVGAFRAYADFMLKPEFETIVKEVEKLVSLKRAAFMCAEALPWQCHRQLLADAFVVRGWRVRDIMDGGCRAHKLPPFARPEGTRIIYSGLV
jgi:hypothetical protein